MNEMDLEESFATGGEEVINGAIEKYGQDLLRYCHSITGNYHDAQDIVQITFIKAYSKRKKYKKGTSLSAWLYKIAYNTTIDTMRKRRLLFFLPENKEDNSYISEDIQEALKTLSVADRALVFSRVIEEKSYSELEYVYGASAATLRKRYERAKKKLAKVLVETNSYYEILEVTK